VAAWFEKREDARPFFLYLHATDPHSPYVPPRETRERFAAHVTDSSIGQRDFVKQLGELPGEPGSELISNLAALYDAEVAAVDAAFAELLDLLRSRNVLDDTLVVFTSDHGEEFFDHEWWGHGKTLYEEQLRVPLIVALPDGTAAPTRVKRRVTQVDILPLVLSAVGLEVPSGIQGEARRLPETGDRAVRERPAFALFERGNRSAQSVIDHGMKLIRYGDYAHPLGARPVTQLYDLARDPGERNNLARSRPIMTGYLLTLLKRADQRVPQLTPERAEVDLSIESRLRALGYIQ
jgi:arylsulfatase A-like enzyme